MAKSSIKNDAEFLATSRREYSDDCALDRVDRDEAMDDHAFVYSSDATVRSADGKGSQWSPQVFSARKERNRPILQWNRMHTYQAHVVNVGRQNAPSVQVSHGDNGTPETADFFQDRIRQIEYDCDGNISSDIARDNQCSSGRGFERIVVDFKPGTFKQEVRIEPIEDQFRVVWGPGTKYSREDSDRCWVICRITKEAHRREFGEDTILNGTDFKSSGELSDWVGLGQRGDMVQIAEKFQKEYKRRTLYKLWDGKAISNDNLNPEEIAKYPPDPKTGQIFELDESGEIVERVEDVVTVCRYVIDGAQILKRDEFIIPEIPIICWWGLCVNVNGVQRAYSLGNRAKDAQRLVNLYISNIAELIGKQTKNKWKAEIGSILEQHRKDWQGQTSADVLFYNRFSEDMRDLGIPEEIVSDPQIQALSLGLQQALEGMKAAHGIYDASMGERSNETSGVAIESRKRQAETVNYHFAGNEARSHKRRGQLLIKIIAKLDAPGSNVPIRSQDGKTRIVPIGKEYRDPSGKMVTHVLNDSDYGVNVEMGPTYRSAMDQVHQTDSELIKAVPELITVLGAEFMRTQNAPGAEQRADIMTRWINQKNPGLLEDKENQGEMPIPPAVQQQLQSLQQENDTLKAFAQEQHAAADKVKAGEDTKILMQEKEIAFRREELTTKTRLELAKLGSKEELTLLERELDMIGGVVDREHADATAQAGRDHADSQAEAAREHEIATTPEQGETE